MKLSLLKSCVLLQCLLSCFMYGQSQTKFDPGKVKSDPNFICTDNSSIPLDSSINKIGRICDSKNQMEIRLKAISLPHYSAELIVLSFNNNEWDAKKFNYTKGSIGDNFIYTGIGLDPAVKNLNDRIFNIIFDSLKANKVFLLPSQSELNLEGDAHDGVAYMLTFKVDNSYRSYTYRNLKYFIQQNNNIPELKNFESIIQNLKSLFN